MTLAAASPFTQAAFHAAGALCGVCLAFLLLLLAIVARRAARRRARAAASAAIRPRLQEALVEFVAGNTDDSRLRNAMAAHAEDVADCILGFQSTVGGSARDRLCRLALDLALVHQWCEECRSRDVEKRRTAVGRLGFACVYEPCRRVAGDLLLEALEDQDPEVRLSACRGLALFGGAKELGLVFTLAVGPNRLTRTVLTENLRPHAIKLVAGALREVLRSGDAERTAAALEILAAWERAIPLENLGEFMDHRDARVRRLAFRLAAFLPVDMEGRLTLVRALHDPDQKIRALAIIAIGRQKMTDSLPELAECLRREGLELARHAAEALAAMPPEGWQTLAELSESENAVTARAAREALARVRVKAGNAI